MSIKNQHFAKYIKEFLNESQLSSRQLALLAGLEHASIGQYVRGERLPRVSSLIYLTTAIAKHKNVNFKDELYNVIMCLSKDI
tara:strand:- start:310 stop:558 length:249 start_codon:yes stop_codon:yes gene_type:complete